MSFNEYTLRAGSDAGDGRRRIAGIIAPYGETIVRPEDGKLEQYGRGAFNGYLERSDRAKVVLIDEHGRHEGATIGAEVAWQDRPEGLWMEFELADTTRSHEVADLADMGALWGLSAGFREGDVTRSGDLIVHTGVQYFNHCQITSRPLYKRAQVVAVRTEDNNEMIEHENIEPTETATESVDTVRAELGELRTAVDTLTRRSEAAAAAPATAEAPPLEELAIRSVGEYLVDTALALRGEGLAHREARQRLETLQDQLPQLRAFDATSSPISGLGGAVPDVFMGPIVDLIRAGQPFLNALANSGLSFPLPANGMDIHRPKVSQGTTVAWEATEGDEPASQAYQTTDVTGAVKAVKGRFRLTLQTALRTDPSAVDAATRDLAAAITAEFDNSAINGTGTLTATTGALAGVLANGSIQSATAMATFTAATLTASMANAESLVWAATNRAPLFWVMHSRRYSAIRGLLDSSNRPIMQVHDGGRNVLGNTDTASGGSALGGPGQPVAELYGYPVVIDNNIPTGLGVGTDEDIIMLVGAESFELYQDPTRTLQLQVPDDFQTTFGMAKLGLLLPVRPDAVATIGGAGLT